MRRSRGRRRGERLFAWIALALLFIGVSSTTPGELIGQTPPIHPRMQLSTRQDLEALQALFDDGGFRLFTNMGFVTGPARGSFGALAPDTFGGGLTFGDASAPPVGVRYTCSRSGPLTPGVTPGVIGLVPVLLPSWCVWSRIEVSPREVPQPDLYLADVTSRDFLEHVLQRALDELERPFARGFELRGVSVLSESTNRGPDLVHAVFTYETAVQTVFVQVSAESTAVGFGPLDVGRGG